MTPGSQPCVFPTPYSNLRTVSTLHNHMCQRFFNLEALTEAKFYTCMWRSYPQSLYAYLFYRLCFLFSQHNLRMMFSFSADQEHRLVPSKTKVGASGSGGPLTRGVASRPTPGLTQLPAFPQATKCDTTVGWGLWGNV